ncbi:MAG: 4'-phosphopantetheinyl transferase superfamily protein [Aphanocapsa sp. GSE-SYN-MK-11-07L]|nr:4'-phosphopantetheinyl transferase superfamily protein [Aphanocapsa sp. GSE-SYN-MK-11-07L]
MTFKDRIDSSSWQIPPANISLKLAEVHLWRASLLPEQTAEFWCLLSQDEQQRAEKFRQPKAQQWFIAARGILRLLLSRYLNCPPQALAFTYGAHGKPMLQRSFNDLRLEFNLTHSGDLALYAFTLEHPLGIDLEQIRPDFNYLAIAQRFFSAQEVASLLSLPLAEQPTAFFQIWTAKEAYIKAEGGSVFAGLSQFEVKLLQIPAENAWRIDQPISDRCLLYTLNPGPDYVASLVQTVPSNLPVTKQPISVQCWQWSQIQS